MNQKLCCLAKGEKVQSGPDCVCVGRRLCAECTSLLQRDSILWPESNLNQVADNHFRFNRECPRVVYYIKYWGRPSYEEVQTSS